MRKTFCFESPLEEKKNFLEESFKRRKILFLKGFLRKKRVLRNFILKSISLEKYAKDLFLSKQLLIYGNYEDRKTEQVYKVVGHA